MNLRIVILAAKELASGAHRIRIAISHNSETRYFLTRFAVPSTKNLKNGAVVGLPNAAYVNQQLRNQMNRIYMIYDELDNVDYLTCPQLVSVIKAKLDKGKKQTFAEIAKEWITIKSKRCAEDTIRLYQSGIDTFTEFAGSNYILSVLDSAYVYDYKDWLSKRGLNNTTQNMRIGVLRNIVYFGTTHGYCKFDIPPFFDYKESKPIVRNVSISVQDLRKFRDADLSHKWEICARDIFMLSFYLCGMNLGDILSQDLSLSFVSFIRLKTKSRRDPNDLTEFSIQPEARQIIDRYMKDGHLQFHDRKEKKSISHITDDWLKKAKEHSDISCRLIYYSARKTFAQIANQLGIKDSVIEYCLGDAPSNSHRAISFYIKVNRRMADDAIRKVFDFVASDCEEPERYEDYLTSLKRGLPSEQ